MTSPKRCVETLRVDTVFSGYFSVIKLHVRHTLHRGGMSSVVTREVFERGNSVCVIPFDPVTGNVLMVEQFRAGMHHYPTDHRWLWEPVAGVIDAGEDKAETARREAREEAGLELRDLISLGDIIPSAGGCSEVTRYYIGLCDLSEAGGHYGMDDEAEDIRADVRPLDDWWQMMQDSDQVWPANTVICLSYLKLHATKLMKQG